MNNPQDIARRIKAGDEQAFEQVFRTHYAGMCGYANKYLSDIDQAEEIVQEVFFSYWNKKEALEITESLEGYLYRAVRNSCLNYLKHLRVRAQFALSQGQPSMEDAHSSYNEIIVLELQQKIDQYIRQLPAERQKIFKLSRFEGLKYREIADQLGLSIKTVETQMGKALKFLRENLSEYLPLLLLLGVNARHWRWLVNLFLT